MYITLLFPLTTSLKCNDISELVLVLLSKVVSSIGIDVNFGIKVLNNSSSVLTIL